MFSYFEFFSAKPEDLTSNREFYISTLFIKNSEDNHIINIKSECEFPKEIYNLISKLINIRNQRKDWVITNHIKYNFSIDMLKGLRNDND